MNVENPTAEDLYNVGTFAYIKQMVKLPNGTIRVLVEGLERANWDELQRKRYCTDEVTVTALLKTEESGYRNRSLMRTLRT